MGNVLTSLDNMLSQATSQGLFSRFVYQNINNNTTNATSTCGYTTARRFPATITVPTLGGSVTGAYLVGFRMASAQSGPFIVGFETLLGSLTVSTNSFTAGSTLPSRIVNGTGSAQQLASIMPIVAIGTTITATSPVLTVTYTNQAGTGARTCTMTLPTSSAAMSEFLMSPHLQGTDTGIRSVSNISISTGSAGVINIYGIIPLAVQGSVSGPDPIPTPFPLIELLGGDVLSFHSYNVIATDIAISNIVLVGEN